ncbi:hypothetical protein CAEBREN_02034 [Caenorhabditis brenneri]|uniref:Fe2OG dioxygenase domain-containing protein n=1 Tax=Caenorhabditis brenneri TaxID=135651 RepID=G0N4I2_CAEBE|nr:hypothetical protein CAEBREN_02034 [Caenorhabditis brenneri]
MSVMNFVVSNLIRVLFLAATIYYATVDYKTIQGFLSSSSPAEEKNQLNETGMRPSSKPKFSGENYWMAEDQEMCDDPEKDRTWMKKNALCFLVNQTNVLSKVEVISWSPIILVYKEMFSGDQVANWIHVFNKQQLEPQETVNSDGNIEQSKFRVADGVMTAEEDFPEARSLAETAAKHLPYLNFGNSEPIVGVSYQPGGHYSRHYDFFDLDDGIEFESMEKGNRMTTVIMVFQKAEVGGGTMFPLLKTTVRAEPGDAIVWFNMRKNGEMEPLVEHAGCPVRSGRKIIATVWLRSKEQPILKEGDNNPNSFDATDLLQ